MGRIAGIDVGTVRIGLAISDERKVIASSLETIRAGKTPQECALKIKEALSKYPHIEKIVVGLPLLLSGKESPMSLLARAIGDHLQQVANCEVIFWDERLTSAGVERMLMDCDVSRKKRASLSDALCAISILQNYLDSLRS